MDTKYYFIKYRWKNNRDGQLYWNHENATSNIHPILWLKNRLDNFEKKITRFRLL